jgi:hypothetical protein
VDGRVGQHFHTAAVVNDTIRSIVATSDALGDVEKLNNISLV